MAEKLMQALQYSKYGGGAASLKHVEVAVPKPKTDEVLIKIEATSLNPVDLKIQKGVMRPFAPKKFPFIPCFDVAGEIVEVGAGVKKFKSGDKVLASLYNQGGGLAEYAAAKESMTALRPDGVSSSDAACLGIAGITAYQALEAAGVKFDGTGTKLNILVTAGSGGVGHYAVQLAKLGNAHVTATCGSRNLEFVKSLGADEVIDYKTPEGAALKSPSGKKYDGVIHCTTGIPWSTFEPNMSPVSKVIDLSPSGGTMWTIAKKKISRSKKQYEMLISTQNGETLEILVKLMKEGKLKTVIDSKYSLSKAEDAWAKCIESHATGKIVVEP